METLYKSLSKDASTLSRGVFFRKMLGVAPRWEALTE